jgi:hypothetical protein
MRARIETLGDIIHETLGCRLLHNFEIVNCATTSKAN